MSEKVNAKALIEFEQALALHQSGAMKQAENLYRQSLQKNAQHADTHHLLGILLGQQGRYEEAVSPLRSALALEPGSPSFHNSLGNVEKHLGHIECAIFHYQQALQSPSASSAVHNNLGILFQQKQAWDQALTCYSKAIELRPDYADAHYNLSTVLTQQEKYSEAIVHLELTLQYQPDHGQAHTHLAQLLLLQHRPEEAIVHCKQRLSLDPDHVETHHQLAVALTQQNGWEEAVIHYQRTLTLQPDHAEALHNLGALYMVQRKPELALACYLKQLNFHPDFDAYYNIGVIYLYQDRHEDAIQYLSEALRLEPQAFNAHLNLGAVYLKTESLEKAAFHYEAALAIKPDDPELLYILAALSKKPAPTAAPAAYIEHLFDQYAPYFDRHLTHYLHYQVPKLLHEAVITESGGVLAVESLLDLGCGTGLCGEAFHAHVQTMIGVDLSQHMLEAARDKKIYAEVKQADIHAALVRYVEMDLIIAGDVFGYMGDLQPIFSLVANALKKTGLFAFTTEKTGQGDFQLQSNARFAHRQGYVEALAQANDFAVLRCDNAVLRSQKGQAVEGVVWVLGFSKESTT